MDASLQLLRCAAMSLTHIPLLKAAPKLQTLCKNALRQSRVRPALARVGALGHSYDHAGAEKKLRMVIHLHCLLFPLFSHVFLWRRPTFLYQMLPHAARPPFLTGIIFLVLGKPPATPVESATLPDWYVVGCWEWLTCVPLG